MFHFSTAYSKIVEIWAYCVNTSMEMLSAFIDSNIDNVLFQTNQDFTSHFLNL